MKRAHKNLEVWQESVTFATAIYKATEAFPKSEIYGLTSQMRRAAVSVPSNVAEGAARSSAKEFAHFLSISGGSLSELDTQIQIAANLGYISQLQKQELDKNLDSIAAKLAGLIRNVKDKCI